MRHYGDICKISGAEIEPVDCIIGGSPCQDLSIAGKRAGLAGARSGLYMEQIRIIREMREHDRETGWSFDLRFEGAMQTFREGAQKPKKPVRPSEQDQQDFREMMGNEPLPF